ncbi:uncharacterized protein V1516DRAFT_679425 [Lipomyces oligophaga]|uniref:uncharacterized protein n=1 Tax=Lipomyces oligophaga TaxID=45792 RepID=UPI0034CDFD46
MENRQKYDTGPKELDDINFSSFLGGHATEMEQVVCESGAVESTIVSEDLSGDGSRPSSTPAIVDSIREELTSESSINESSRINKREISELNSDSSSGPGSTQDSFQNIQNETVRNVQGAPSSTFHGPILNLNIPRVLPHEQVFPIQVGDTLFRLSGASLSSDAPSYFTAFFKAQRPIQSSPGGPVTYPTLYIDRSPDVFREIVKHLQGYSVAPRDEYQFVYLYADAHYYQLPKLVKLLYNSDIFVRIGSKDFRVPKELLNSPGDSPNFFTLGFSSFYSSPQAVFPGTRGLIRPPAVLPPAIGTHSDHLFDQLLTALRGGPLHFTSSDHRDQLIRECRYYHFRGLEQTLIPSTIQKNLISGREEITLRCSDIRPAGIEVADETEGKRLVKYRRPFTDDISRDLIIQIPGEELILKSYDVTQTQTETSKCRWGVEVLGTAKSADKLRTLIGKFPDSAKVILPEKDATNMPMRFPCELQDCKLVIDGREILVVGLEDGYVECFRIDSEGRDLFDGISGSGSSKTRTTESSTSSMAAPQLKRQRIEASSHSSTRCPSSLAVERAQMKLYVSRGRLIWQLLIAETISSIFEQNRRRHFLD